MGNSRRRRPKLGRYGRRREAIAESESGVRLLVRSGQRGLAGAITYGWAHTNADLLGVIHADLQHPPELLPMLISKVADGCDIAITSRYVQSHSIDGWNPLRAAISRISLLASKPVQKPALAVKHPMFGYFNRPGSSSYLRFWPEDTLARH
jgi:glycosyltransferase involved in cell wall biosynthesis